MQDWRAEVRLGRVERGLAFEVDAPFHDDPRPPGPAGPTPRLWEYEVVEVFVAGPRGHYLEVEMGPHGHHLVIWLEGIRRAAREALPLELTTTRSGGRWQARAQTLEGVPLPAKPWRVNAYAIHGVGPNRRWLAHAPTPGEHPDFHQLDCFVPWDKLDDVTQRRQL